MSASAKKKLRKEENAALLTEKQRKEQKEARNLKIYTTLFVIAIVAILVAGLAIFGINYFKSSGISEKNTVAAVVGDYEINSVEMSYYYTDLVESTVQNWKSTYGDNFQVFLSLMGLDTAVPLDEQEYSEGTTWADYFVETAAAQAQSDYLLGLKAAEEGFVLSDEAEEELEYSLGQLSAIATIYGYNDVDSYLRSMYGPGASEEGYLAYARKGALAQAFYNNHSDNLEIDDAAIRAYEADKYDQYSSFSYATYNISYNNFLTGGTTAEDGSVSYSDAEREAARAAAKAAADSMPDCTTVEALNDAIAALNDNDSAASECNVVSDGLYNTISTNPRQWLTDSSRKVGDFVVLPNESTTTNDDGEEITVVNSYDAVLFLGRNDNTTPLANVRHILCKYPGGTTDSDGNVTYSDLEKGEALDKAEAILNEFLDGEQTDARFAALATEKTEDTGSAANGGLYENISPEKGIYVEPFTDWATDPNRKAGDTGIIETTYGYHVMYYVGDDELTYRDSMIREDIRTETMSAWYEAILATAEVSVKDTSRLKKDIVLAQ